MKNRFDKKGETYIDVAITVMIVAFVLVFAVNMVSIVALNQNMKTMADQIIDYATTNGSTDINDYVETLRTKSGIGFSCSFAGTDYHTGQKVQLGDIIHEQFLCYSLCSLVSEHLYCILQCQWR